MNYLIKLLTFSLHLCKDETGCDPDINEIVLICLGKQINSQC